MNEKPWQWLIDNLIDELEFWRKHGLDKEKPETFNRIQNQLKKAYEKQKCELKGKEEEAK